MSFITTALSVSAAIGMSAFHVIVRAVAATIGSDSVMQRGRNGKKQNLLVGFQAWSDHI
jgi:hypothetical protein